MDGDGVKDDEDKFYDDEDEQDEKIEASPWAEPEIEDKSRRIVGWRYGEGLTQNEIETILRKEKPARQEYRGLRKAIKKKKQSSKDDADPLQGLPPTWKAFWGTVPHLDAQAAYQEYNREKQRQERIAKKAQDAQATSTGEGDSATVEEDITRLEAKVAELKQALQEKERVSQEWDKKLARVRKLDEDAEEKSRKVKQKLDASLYTRGIAAGKLRSSETYFRYLFEDTQLDQKKKEIHLKRSCSLMEKQMDLLKGHVRMLLKVGAEQDETDRGESNRSDTQTMLKGLLPPTSPRVSLPPMSPQLHD